MLHIGNGKSAGLGDLVVLTAICKQIDCVVDLPPAAAKFAPVFTDLAPVMILEDPILTPVPEGSRDLWIRDKMRTLNKEHNAGLDIEDYLPIIHPTNDAMAWAKREFQEDTWAIKVNCSMTHKLTRECHPAKWDAMRQKIVEVTSGDSTFLAHDRQFIQFGITENYNPVIRCRQRVDLPLDKLIAAYATIGRYIGVDTGDLHVARAVGCKCLAFHPGECSVYRFHRWNYEDENMRYVNFNEMESIDERYMSDFFG